MTAPLNEKGPRPMNYIEQAITDFWGERCDPTDHDCPTCQAWAEYDRLSAVDLPDELEVVAWRVYQDWENAPGEDYYIGPADNGSLDKAIAVRLSKENADRIVQAHFTIAALRAEIEHIAAENEAMAKAAQAAWSKHGGTEIALGQWKARAETAEAQVQRLTEDNEALRAELQDWQNGHSKSVRAHAEAFARVEALEEALRPFSVLELPRLKNAGNAGFYNLRFADIAAARAALNSREKADG